MREALSKHHRILFYSLWLVLGLMQAGLTELQDDEAYYWVYSNFLDWGYFDHPPMIAVMIKAGYFIFENEFGVRLLTVLMSTASLLIIEKLLKNNNPFLFYCIALSIAALQLTGFIAVPDSPLIFFTAVFFWRYKKFITNFSLGNAVFLGLVASLLLYSKYHGVLIIFFVLLSNLKLFTKYQTYVAGIIALLCFAPHLVWQYQHDWVSFRYHLFESNVNPYKLSHSLDYILGQLLLAGPIAGIILLPAALLYKPANKLERALYFTLAGIYIFFFLSTFKGKVEANWTSPAIVPLIVLSHGFLSAKIKWQKLLLRLLPITIVLVLAARVIMIIDVVPIKAVQVAYHAWDDWPQKMKKATRGMPIVFNNSYQRASKYWFYSGQPTYSLNHYQERRNNYNFWPLEDSMLGKPAYILDIFNHYNFTDSIPTRIRSVAYRYDSAFVSFAKVMIVTTEKKIRIPITGIVKMQCKAEIPLHYRDFLLKNPTLPLKLYVAAYDHKGWIEDLYLQPISIDTLLDSNGFSISFPSQLPAGDYYLRFAIQAKRNYPTHNSDKIDLRLSREK